MNKTNNFFKRFIENVKLDTYYKQILNFKF